MKRTLQGDTKVEQYRQPQRWGGTLDSDMSSTGEGSSDENDMCSFLWNDGVKLRNGMTSSLSVASPRQGTPDAAPSSGFDPASASGDSKTVSAQTILAKEMNQLSINQRESVYEEIHGVQACPKEDQQQILKAVAKMERLMKKLPNNQAYMKAVFFNPKYCKTVNIMFLRAEGMNPKPAAKRCVFHFEKKLELFGPECLARSIVWSDLGHDVIDSLRHGYYHFFPTYSDRIGRTINLCVCSKIWEDVVEERHTKSTWYVMMKCLERNDQAQQRGVCTVLYFPGSTVHHFYQFLKMYSASHWVTKALPFRVSVVHLCLEHDSRFPSILASMVQESPTDVRIRTRIHYGSHLECQYALGSFGISIGESLPMELDGSIRRPLLDRRLRELQLHDENAAAQQRSMLVTKHGADVAKTVHVTARDIDVLLGRGQPFQRHPGTVAMMKMVEDARSEHEEAGLFAKKGITKRIVNAIKSKGGFFLQRTDDDMWIEVSDSKAHEKVAMGFRNLARKD